jgi:hypothetical protein
MEDKVLESQSSGYLLLYPSCHLHFLSFEKSEKRRMEQFLPGERGWDANTSGRRDEVENGCKRVNTL